jgi:hypothetical protein
VYHPLAGEHLVPITRLINDHDTLTPSVGAYGGSVVRFIPLILNQAVRYIAQETVGGVSDADLRRLALLPFFFTRLEHG